MLPAMLDVPQPLVDAVLAGRCVAFVGAGFSATVVPTWERLLESVAEREDLSAPDRAAMRELFVAGGQLANEAAAQFLVERMGAERFQSRLIDLVAHPIESERQQHRVDHLLGVPFRGVLTTNFDGVLDGVVPGRDAYRQILRPEGGSGWYQDRYWHGTGPTVVKLHGDAVSDPESIVLTRRDYRDRLYGKSAYVTFLRAVFATNTMLFLGCSFNDPYLNELRSEILALLEQRDVDQPLAYAVIPDQPGARVAFFRQHEGMQLLTYDTADHPDHAPFDGFLERLYGKTSPLFHLGRLLGGRKILWLDPYPDSTEEGIQLLRRAAGLAEAGFSLSEGGRSRSGHGCPACGGRRGRALRPRDQPLGTRRRGAQQGRAAARVDAHGGPRRAGDRLRVGGLCRCEQAPRPEGRRHPLLLPLVDPVPAARRRVRRRRSDGLSSDGLTIRRHSGVGITPSLQSAHIER